MNKRAFFLKAHSPIKETLKVASNSLRFEEIHSSSLHPTPPHPTVHSNREHTTLSSPQRRYTGKTQNRVKQKAKEFVNFPKFCFPEAGRIEGSSGGAKTHMREKRGRGLPPSVKRRCHCFRGGRSHRARKHPSASDVWRRQGFHKPVVALEPAYILFIPIYLSINICR